MFLGQKIDAPLSDIGTRQSEAAGLYLRDVKFTNVFVSDMKRAKQASLVEMSADHSQVASFLQRCYFYYIHICLPFVSKKRKLHNHVSLDD